jgi:molybdopterin converting factor small subunit
MAIAEGTTVREALGELSQRYPGLADMLWDGDGQLGGRVAVFINNEVLDPEHGLESRMDADSVLYLFPPLEGG